MNDLKNKKIGRNCYILKVKLKLMYCELKSRLRHSINDFFITLVAASEGKKMLSSLRLYVEITTHIINGKDVR